MRFRKKPVVVEAVKVVDILEARDVPSWVREAVHVGDLLLVTGQGVHVLTLNGRIFADQSEWLVLGIRGELYPCAPDIFEQTYDPVETQPGSSDNAAS